MAAAIWHNWATAEPVKRSRGGHLFLGHDAEVRKAISAFVASAGPKPA
jgi:hypothetical protein